MDPHSRSAVRTYLRGQRDRHKLFVALVGDKLMEEWNRAYHPPKVSSEGLLSLANQFAGACEQAGMFGISKRYIRPSRSSPYREKARVNAFHARPIGLCRKCLSGAETSFTENCLIIELCTGEFGRKKGVYGFGFTGLVLTQHVLERIYERTEVPAPEFEGLLQDNLVQFMKGAALAAAAGLWIESENEEGFDRVSAVPYANGLLILRSRVLVGDTAEGEFGFRMLFPSGRFTVPFTNPAIHLDRDSEGRPLREAAQLGILTCGITYLDRFLLRPDQEDYFYGFQALADSVGEDFLLAMIAVNFGPRHSHVPHYEAELYDEYMRRADKLRTLLERFGERIPGDPFCVQTRYEG